MKKNLLVSLLCLLTASAAFAAEWTFAEGSNLGGPGKRVDVNQGGKLIARLVFGDGQFKPYLHVFGAEGELLTNGGLDENGKATGTFPHHRGIFIGWNKIGSDLNTTTYDLWHLNNGGKMELTKAPSLKADADRATIVATVAWRGGRKDDAGSDLLLTETRTLVFSRPDGKRTQIDATFALAPARDLKLEGDLQHAGVHFRASNEVATRAKETSYLSDPDKAVKGGNLQWCRLLFPIGSRWYTAQEMNAPSNPVEELSMRDYGRFGYFFKKALKKDESLTLNYRFVIAPAEVPAEKPKPSAEQTAKSHAECEANYREFVKALKR